MTRPDPRRPSWVVLGCGHVGERLAARLAAKREAVLVTSRRVERAEALAAAHGVEARVLDAHDGAALAALPPGAIVVDGVPPDPARPPHTAGLVAARPRRVVYLSSTGVYPLGDGSWVDEDTPVGPASARGRARLADEEALRASGLDAIVLRVAAIEGPGRGVEARLRQGTYRLVDDGARWVSRVHVDDLVEVILAAGRIAAPPRRIYCVSDGRPTTARAHAEAVAARLGLPPPPSVPLSAMPEEVHDLVASNRRVSNRRLAELGVVVERRP